jgi:Ni,Fe-hydrogenase maturation factor
MVIKFGDNTDGVTVGAILEGLTGWTLKVEYVAGVTGFPESCSIDRTNRDEVIICDVDEVGKPMPNSLYHVGHDEIKSITVV